mmetsp:Transcript_44658/g.119098  ORF Transcript_44658/g.119098 Transcript_44658/m.119098 type:complete len:144 (-) Transcript_44658:69-500(-)
MDNRTSGQKKRGSAEMCAATGLPMKRSRTVLTQEQAIQIFDLSLVKKHPSAMEVAARYGICDKAVRDIWNMRTWARVTKERTMKRQRGNACCASAKSTGASASSGPATIDEVLFEWSEIGPWVYDAEYWGYDITRNEIVQSCY